MDRAVDIAFSEGFNAGWNKAWQEFNDVQRENQRKVIRLPHKSENPVVRLELSDEWAEFLVENEKLRREFRKQEEKEEAELARANKKETKSESVVSLGAHHDAEQRSRAVRLYGSNAERVLQKEALLNALFQRASAQHPAQLWPIVPLPTYRPDK